MSTLMMRKSPEGSSCTCVRLTTMPLETVSSVSSQTIWSPTGENSSFVGGSAAAVPGRKPAPTTQATNVVRTNDRFMAILPSVGFGEPTLHPLESPAQYLARGFFAQRVAKTVGSSAWLLVQRRVLLGSFGIGGQAGTAAGRVFRCSLLSSPSVSVSRPGSVQRVNAIDEEMDEKAGALSTW